MAKFFLYFLVAIASLSFLFTGCDDDDDVARDYAVTVSLNVPDDISLSDVSELKVVAANITSGAETEIAISGSTGSEVLNAGEYNFRVSGKTDNYNLSGLTQAEVYEDKEVSIDLVIAAGSGLIFKEVYFTGVPSCYWRDGFYEIYNNSDEVQYLDGVILGCVSPGTGMGGPTPWVDKNGELLDRYPMNNSTFYFPGSGEEHPLQPGESVVVASSAINHSARELTDEDVASPVDLSNAEWETYVEGEKDNDENAPNLELMYHLWGFDFFPFNTGTPLILAKLPEGTLMADFIDNEDNYERNAAISWFNNLMLPHEYVIDAIDITNAEDGEHYKHLHASEDVGMTWVWGADGPGTSGGYSGKSLRRKVVSITSKGRVIYKDTNNSSEDFILGGQTPTPGVNPSSVD